jgi:uncharacterized protein (DUF433 family)
MDMMQEYFKYVERNPQICGGVPVFKGTRLPIHVILDFLSAGDTMETIIENYPQLSKEQIRGAIAYVSELARYKEEEIEITDR